jgi:hypothetical protein
MASFWSKVRRHSAISGKRISTPDQYQAHFKFLQDKKLLDVSDSRWAKATVDGEVCYSVLTVPEKRKMERLTLPITTMGGFDRHLLDNPGENTDCSLTSK